MPSSSDTATTTSKSSRKSSRSKSSSKSTSSSKKKSSKSKKSASKIGGLDLAAGVKVVEVIAPANLPGGYEFLANVDGQPTLIRVPKDGVYQEQKFFARVVEEIPASTSSFWHNVPHNKWRDNLCDCLSNGCCHPMFCFSIFCLPMVLGQVMTRLNLDPCGRFDQRLLKNKQTGTKAPYWTPFKAMGIVAILVLVVNVGFNVSILVKALSGVGEEDPPLDTTTLILLCVRCFLDFCLSTYIFVMMIYTRNYIRRRYNIRASGRCGGCGGACEDACCSVWCTFCATTQMARHTASYHAYTAVCCTDTGIPRRAPQFV